MKINKLSDNLTPLDEGIIFGIDTENDTASDIVVEVINTSTDEVVAVIQLHNIISANLDIAPYITRLSRYAPATTRHSAFAEAPTASYKIRIDDTESDEIVVSVNCNKIGSDPAIVTTLPHSRRIARGENDEVMFSSEPKKNISAEFVADTGETLHLEYMPTSEISLLAISIEDFDSNIASLDITLYCEDEEFGKLHYTVAPPLNNATRLAWLSECGTIEQYTFPISHKVRYTTEKQSVLTSDGICSAHHKTKQTTSLCSRFESRAVIEALAKIIYAPKVWAKRENGYELVEVATTNIEHDLFGQPAFIHLDICLWQKGVALW